MTNKDVGKTSLEFTFTAILIGLVVGAIMTAANVYLGLYAGMTVSASIPAAVIAVAVLRLLKRSSILEANIVQTMASAGESVAAGVIFTIPALVLVGVWNEFHFWPTTLIAICGALLGVVFMIPLRKALIIEDKNLTYPEGVACATVLQSTSGDISAEKNNQEQARQGAVHILKGLGLGGIFKVLTSGLGVLKSEVAMAGQMGKSVFFFGSDISPALLAVGYIVRLEVALMVFLGGSIGWFLGIPLLTPPVEDIPALDKAWILWSGQIRYIGVGAMIVGGLWSIFSVRQGIASGVQSLKDSYQKGATQQVQRTEVNMDLVSLAVIFAFALIVMFFMYNYLIGQLGLSLFTTILMVLASFLFVAVSSYVVGLVGSSNNPVSGMTISALLGTAALFLVLGFEGESAILATLGVAAVVCCAACTAGDCSQDLKTGFLVKATPKYQQWAQVIGVTLPVLVIAPILTVLHSEYGIGDGLKAPQATLFASLSEGLFGDGNLPYNMVGLGIILGLLILVVDNFYLKGKKGFRLHVMPVAVGIYLPVTLSVPIFIGGVMRAVVEKVRSSQEDQLDSGILLGSGLIAGEAIMGVVLAVFAYFSWNMEVPPFLPHWLGEVLSVAAFVALAWHLKRVASEKF